jgi:hypothetical protein
MQRHFRSSGIRLKYDVAGHTDGASLLSLHPSDMFMLWQT